VIHMRQSRPLEA